MTDAATSLGARGWRSTQPATTIEPLSHADKCCRQISQRMERLMVSQIQLNDEDVTYLLTLLRNAAEPITTQQLIDALRRQSGQR